MNLPICVFILLILFGCLPNKQNNDIPEVNTQIHTKSVTNSPDSLWKIAGPRAVFWPDTSTYHLYGELSLKWRSDSDRGEYLYKKGYGDDAIYYRESYPGVVFLQKQRGEFTEVRYYSLKKLEKIINIKRICPYRQKLNKLISKNSNYERYSSISNNLNSQEFHPDSYSISFWSEPTSINGYTFVYYELMSIFQNSIINWETTILAIDPKGEIVGKLVENNYAYPIEVSKDKRLIAYHYGNFPDNPMDSAPNGIFKVVDLTSGHEVLKILPQPNEQIQGAIQRNIFNGMIMVAHVNHADWNHEIVDLIDLDNRVRYYYKFNDLEFTCAWETFKAYLPMLDYYNFTRTYF